MQTKNKYRKGKHFMSKKIISKISLKTIGLAAAVTVCGVFCFDYIIGNEALAFDGDDGVVQGSNTGGGNDKN